MDKTFLSQMRQPIVCSLLVAGAAIMPVLAQEWKQTEFVIGSYYDPPVLGVESEEEITAHYQCARDAGFNLLLGHRAIHGYGTPSTAKLNDLAVQHGFKMLQGDSYLRHTAIQSLTPAAVSRHLAKKRQSETGAKNILGCNFFDEPRDNKEDKDRVRTVLAAARENYPGQLMFVNLLPSYGFSSWKEFVSYAKTYTASGMGLQVISFDNYHPDTEFTYAERPHRFFSDLALLRRLAGTRPLWSYINTRQRVQLMKPRQQRAFIWLSAFAPVAYGAKGLLYFTYDRYDPYELRQGTDYHTRASWGKSIFYEAPPSEPVHTFLGHFRTDETRDMADVASYSDAAGGTWCVKYATSLKKASTRRTDWKGIGAGTDALPFVGDLDGDGLDDLLTITEYGTLRSMSPLKGDDVRTTHLPECIGMPQPHGIIVGDADGNGKGDLVMQVGNITCLYANYNPVRRDFRRRTEWEMLENAHFLEENGQIYAVVDDRLCWLEKGEEWTELRHLVIASDAAPADHYWLEDGLLRMQDSKGKVWQEIQPDGRLGTQLPKLTEDFLYKVGRLNPQTKKYDLYGLAKPRYEYNGLLNTHGQPTELHGFAAAANLYIHQVLAPIVLNEEWLGTYHAELPREERPEIIELVSGKTPIVKQLPTETLAGVFRKDKNTYHLLVVNVTDRTLKAPSITLKAASVQLLPRMEEGRMDFTAHPSGKQMTVTVPELRGGECVALEVKTK